MRSYSREPDRLLDHAHPHVAPVDVRRLGLEAAGPAGMTLDLTIGALEDRRDPTDAGLGPHQLDVGETLRDRAQQHVGQGQLPARGGGRDRGRERGLGIDQRHVPARSDVHAHRQAGGFGRGEERIPVARGVVQRRETVTDRVLGEAQRLRALRRAPLDLAGGEHRIPDLADDHRHEQAGRSRRAPLVEDEVVPRLDAHAREVLVGEAVEEHAAEPRQRRERDARQHALRQQVAGAFLRVVAARDHVGEACGFHVPLVAGLAGDGVETHGEDPLVLVHPVLATVLLDHVGRGLAVLRRHPAGPDVGRFDDVIIHAEDREHGVPLVAGTQHAFGHPTGSAAVGRFRSIAVGTGPTDRLTRD